MSVAWLNWRVYCGANAPYISLFALGDGFYDLLLLPFELGYRGRKGGVWVDPLPSSAIVRARIGIRCRQHISGL